VALVAAIGGCTDSDTRASGDEAPDLAVSSTMVEGDAGELLVASPDDRLLVTVDRDDLSERERVELPTTPHHVLWTSGGRAVVTGEGVELWVRGTTGAPTPVAVPCAETAGSAELPGDGSVVAATCPIDDRVVVVDVAEGRVLGSFEVPGRPEAVAVAGDELVVLADHGAQVWTGPVPTLARGERDGELLDDVELQPTAPWAPEGRGISALEALSVDDGEWVAAYQAIDNDTARDPTDPADTGSYGDVESGDARIQPMLTGACASAASDFAAPETAASGVHALAYDSAHDRVWVVGQYSATVLVLQCDDDPEVPASVVASFPVAVGASGIVLSDDGGTAWVDLAFDHAVARLDLPEQLGEPSPTLLAEPTLLIEPTAVRARPVGPTQLSSEALAGRRVFHDATDVHLTPSGVVTCASCHPGGGDDGRTWRIGTLEIPSKLRRTPALQGLVDGAKPFHADAGFDSLAALTTDTIRQLMAGDALLVDAGSVSTYLSELAPDPAPYGLDPAAVERGRVLFESPELSCATCHTGASGSDGRTHVVDPRPSDPDALAAPVLTPRLDALASRAPYLHGGSAVTLDDVLAAHPDGDRAPSSWLSASELDDLRTYLRSR
jgi:mono/diheme cytochrome c family protein